jgi:hypothetical protein
MKKLSIIILMLLALVLFFAVDPLDKPNEAPIKDHIPCQPEQRNADACIEIFQPVCGLVDTNIRCITEPCPSSKQQTFSNSCHACRDKNVLGYTRGECT